MQQLLVDDARRRVAAWLPFALTGGREGSASFARRWSRPSPARDALVFLAGFCAVVLAVPAAAGAGIGSLPRYVGAMALSALLLAGLLALGGLYAPRRSRPRARVYTWLTAAATVLTALSAVAGLLGLDGEGRPLALAGAAVGTACVALVHGLEQALDAGGAAQRLIVAGSPARARQVTQCLGTARDGRVVATVVVAGDESAVDLLPHALPRLVAADRPDAVVLALPAGQHDRLVDAIGICSAYGLRCLIAPEATEFPTLPVSVEQLGSQPLLAVRDRTEDDWYAAVKRAGDVIAAGALLVALAPLFALVALLIKLDSPGPVFYRQERMGRGCRPFCMYKFRSMRQDADQHLAQLLCHNQADGPLFKMKDDPRVTRVGVILRRLSIDELPQLINVALGHMSLVGPRPPLRREVERYALWQCRRLAVTPGVTGLWQVSGRSDLAFEQGVRLDLHYVERRSLLLDLAILLRTIPAVLARRGAY